MRTSVLIVAVNRPEIRLSQTGPWVLRRRGRSGIYTKLSSPSGGRSLSGCVRITLAMVIVQVDAPVAVVVDAVAALRPRRQLDHQGRVQRRVLHDRRGRGRIRNGLPLIVRRHDRPPPDVLLMEREGPVTDGDLARKLMLRAKGDDVLAVARRAGPRHVYGVDPVMTAAALGGFAADERPRHLVAAVIGAAGGCQTAG